MVVEVKLARRAVARKLYSTKVAEYLEAGVLAVLVLDDDSRTALLATADQPPRRLGPDDELTITEILPGFAVPVRRLFERDGPRG